MIRDQEDVDIGEDAFDFSKWRVHKRHDARGKVFYMIIRKDNKPFFVALPIADTKPIKVSVCWIE